MLPLNNFGLSHFERLQRAAFGGAKEPQSRQERERRKEQARKTEQAAQPSLSQQRLDRLVERNRGCPLIVGYIVLFNELSCDRGGYVERIEPGAFRAAIGNWEPCIIATCDHDKIHPIADEQGDLSLEEDSAGLRFSLYVRNGKTQRVLDAIAQGKLHGCSFSGTGKADYRRIDTGVGLPVLSITRFPLAEVSFCIQDEPAYPSTRGRQRVIRPDI